MFATNRLKVLRSKRETTGRTRLLLERLEERCLLAGGVVEFPIPTTSSQPFSIVSGPDGNLWFTEMSVDKVGTITTTGTVSDTLIPTASSSPAVITDGPNNNLWFTEMTGDKIAEVTTAKKFTEFIVPTASSGPLGITTGPDGNLWFTEQTANKIGVVTTSGKFTEFILPTANSEPSEITTGPDGNLWFTEMGGNIIGRITPTGTVTEFPLPTAASAPYGITTGPDGNLWFTEMSGNKIGRITTSGSITEFPVLTLSSAPFDIAAGPDGNLWFTEQSGNKIGQITTSGAVTEFPVLTASSEPTGITAGPDGNMWFTEQSADKIGQELLTTTSPPPPSGGGSSTTSLALSPFPTVQNGSEIGAINGSASINLDSNGDGIFDDGDAMFTFGSPGDAYLAGNWSGVGFDDVGIARPTSSGTKEFVLDNDGNSLFNLTDSVFFFGLNTDTPLAGDWDGTGPTRIGVARAQANGSAVFTLDTNGDGVFDAGDQVYSYGQAGDMFISGDWNGAGKTEIGIVRPMPSGELEWVLDTNGDGVFDSGDSVFFFGANGDTPVVGDWNGAGKDEIGVERPQANGTAIWTLDYNGNGTFDSSDKVFAFGQASDQFITGKWTPPPPALFSGDGVLSALVQALKADANFVAIVNQAIMAWEQAGITPQDTAPPGKRQLSNRRL